MLGAPNPSCSRFPSSHVSSHTPGWTLQKIDIIPSTNLMRSNKEPLRNSESLKPLISSNLRTVSPREGRPVCSTDPSPTLAPSLPIPCERTTHLVSASIMRMELVRMEEWLEICDLSFDVLSSSQPQHSASDPSFSFDVILQPSNID
jgi:hypothetical protein